MEKSNGLDDTKTDSDMVKVTPVATANQIPECEMDALLLGRIGVSNQNFRVQTYINYGKRLLQP